MEKPKFKTKKEEIEWLISNKSELIEMKKATLKFGDIAITPSLEITNKALSTNYNDDPTTGMIKRSLIANTYNWMDSHDDVHVGNTFGKSIKERANKVFHLHDHKHEVTAKVGRFTNIQEAEIKWSDLDVSKEGDTTVLIADSEIKEKLNKDVFNQYLDGEIDQHSVGMRYVKISLAVNDEDYPEEKKTWDEYYPKLGNPERANEKDFFWAVKEAVLIEISAVLMGSNELTPTVQNIEPSDDTQKTEPSNDTQKEKVRIFVKF